MPRETTTHSTPSHAPCRANGDSRNPLVVSAFSDRQRTATQATVQSYCLASRALGRVAAAGSSPAQGDRRPREGVRPLSRQAVRCCNVLRCAAMRRAALPHEIQHIGSAQSFRPMEEAAEPFDGSLLAEAEAGVRAAPGPRSIVGGGGGVGSERRSQRSPPLGTRRGQGSSARARSAARKPERRAKDDPPRERKKTTRPRHMRARDVGLRDCNEADLSGKAKTDEWEGKDRCWIRQLRYKYYEHTH